MKFLKFWWEHSLRDIALVGLVFVVWAWISGYIHWWAYKTFANENHWEALIATLVIWMVIILALGAAIGFVIAPVIQYFTNLWKEYKKREKREG